MITAVVIGIAVGLLTGGVVYLFWVKPKGEKIVSQAYKQAKEILEQADKEKQAKLKEAEVVAKEKLLQARAEFEKVSRQRRNELEEFERRLTQREDTLERKSRDLYDLEKELRNQEKEIDKKIKEIETKERELDKLIEEQQHKLEQLSGITAQEAKEELIRLVENEARIEAAHLMRKIEEETKENAVQEAQKIIATAIQKIASDYVSETTVSVVNLPNDEMKGRIIGREGRNIRTFESILGVDLIVDDTPKAVVISSFDPIRRAIAKLALERLIVDGRIHPARIEEITAKVQEEFEEHLVEVGKKTLLKLNISRMHPELVKLLGKLKYRTSYGQNVLDHSIDVAFLAASMAAELKVNVQIAKRAGLLHDIGKAVDREMEGGHLELGRMLLRKYGESEKVIHAMECHHGDYEPRSVEAVLVTAADAMSAVRPGARREVLEAYMRRLEKLEEIASSFEGVKQCYAIQAGREIRIIVDSKKISDEEAIWLARNIAKKVEEELTYPGQIKVTVIREVRSVEYAR